MSSLVKKGWVYTYTSTSGKELVIELLSHKFKRDLGFLKQDYEHCGIAVRLDNDVFTLPISDRDHPNYQFGIFAGVKKIHRLIELNALCVDGGRSHPVVQVIEEMLREMGVSHCYLPETPERITFANGDWEYSAEDGFVYTLTRRKCTMGYITEFCRIKTEHSFPVSGLAGDDHLNGIDERRSFFTTIPKPVSFAQAVEAFNL